MALNGLFCADVPLRNYSLTLSAQHQNNGITDTGSTDYSRYTSRLVQILATSLKEKLICHVPLLLLVVLSVMLLPACRRQQVVFKFRDAFFELSDVFIAHFSASAFSTDIK